MALILLPPSLLHPFFIVKGLIFTYVMTFGGALAALFSPFVGLLVYVCFAIVRPQFLWAYALPPGGNYSRIVAMGLLAGWALKGFGSWRFGRARVMVVALGGFGLWAVVAMQFAVDRPSPGRWSRS